MATRGMSSADPGQQRRLRRSAWLWALIAASFYVGFILMSVVRGWK
jgi:hypothetical protein